jgi:hypothetical protein
MARRSPSGGIGGLSTDAVTFTRRLAANTGLSPAVIAGWVMAETSGWNTTNGPNNWLNVGSFDSGFAGGGANVWQDPATAADATAAFMLGKTVNGVKPPLGGGAASIRQIPQTAGQSTQAQVEAIQSSDWASSHYGYNLMSDVAPFLRFGIQPSGGRPTITRPGGDPATGSSAAAGGAGSGPGGGSGAGGVLRAYKGLRDGPRTAPPGTKNPFAWWWASFTGNWDQVHSS